MNFQEEGGASPVPLDLPHPGRGGESEQEKGFRRLHSFFFFPFKFLHILLKYMYIISFLLIYSGDTGPFLLSLTYLPEQSF